MRLVKCDYCGFTKEMTREFFTSYPSPFSKVEIDGKNYEFCTSLCKKEGLLKLLNEQEISEVKV